MTDMDSAIVWIKPDFFDWGIYKHNGGWILLITALLYLACLISSIFFLWKIGRKSGYPKITLMLGAVCLIPMIMKIQESLYWQRTSLHYQENIHVPALTIIGVSTVIPILVMLLLTFLPAKTNTKRKKIIYSLTTAALLSVIGILFHYGYSCVRYQNMHMEFFSEAWKSGDKLQRGFMLSSLQAEYYLIGMKAEKIDALLGEPDVITRDRNGEYVHLYIIQYLFPERYWVFAVVFNRENIVKEEVSQPYIRQ